MSKNTNDYDWSKYEGMTPDEIYKLNSHPRCPYCGNPISVYLGEKSTDENIVGWQCMECAEVYDTPKQGNEPK